MRNTKTYASWGVDNAFWDNVMRYGDFFLALLCYEKFQKLCVMGKVRVCGFVLKRNTKALRNKVSWRYTFLASEQTICLRIFRTSKFEILFLIFFIWRNWRVFFNLISHCLFVFFFLLFTFDLYWFSFHAAHKRLELQFLKSAQILVVFLIQKNRTFILIFVITISCPTYHCTTH